MKNTYTVKTGNPAFGQYLDKAQLANLREYINEYAATRYDQRPMIDLIDVRIATRIALRVYHNDNTTSYIDELVTVTCYADYHNGRPEIMADVQVKYWHGDELHFAVLHDLTVERHLRDEAITALVTDFTLSSRHYIQEILPPA